MKRRIALIVVALLLLGLAPVPISSQVINPCAACSQSENCTCSANCSSYQGCVACCKIQFRAALRRLTWWERNFGGGLIEVGQGYLDCTDLCVCIGFPEECA